MQMKDVIRQKRRERGLTQEQVAEWLGVSAPAVNKWESGASYPDITLLSALARLLETDLNELFCFRENLTKEEITGYANEIGEIARKDGVEKAMELVRERIREYPSCGELLYQMGVMVRGMSVLFMVPEEELEKNQAFAVELYERAITCGKPATADLARHGLASMYIQEGVYEKAEELINQLPEYQAPDRRQLLISMYMKQKTSGKKAERAAAGSISDAGSACGSGRAGRRPGAGPGNRGIQPEGDGNLPVGLQRLHSGIYCGCERKRCTPVCAAVKRNAGGIVKTVGVGYLSSIHSSGYERIGSEDGTPDDRIVVSSY